MLRPLFIDPTSEIDPNRWIFDTSAVAVGSGQQNVRSNEGPGALKKPSASDLDRGIRPEQRVLVTAAVFDRQVTRTYR